MITQTISIPNIPQVFVDFCYNGYLIGRQLALGSFSFMQLAGEGSSFRHKISMGRTSELDNNMAWVWLKTQKERLINSESHAAQGFLAGAAAVSAVLVTLGDWEIVGMSDGGKLLSTTSSMTFIAANFIGLERHLRQIIETSKQMKDASGAQLELLQKSRKSALLGASSNLAYITVAAALFFDCWHSSLILMAVYATTASVLQACHQLFDLYRNN